MSIDMTLQKWAIFIMVYRHDVTNVGDFYNGGLWGNFVSGCIKNVDTHPESFSWKK